ncbi:FtsK/SpoIIIE domain-containing protein [Allokutzneria sp. NRRL B-24872]|uniref:FtsK/SpoIIIE domain-containing protein n=1 Tax=Allokutzneria sp. NRRL B-24872 TaxID=1137961 RepID=UPI000A3AD9EB|nr:FtsK/SpoIIIE domain-containing protein [Allokutzneria sp. NRRL B-24872]
MNKRTERRKKIEHAFEEFRETVGLALGAAARDHSRAAVAHARSMFELWLRQTGVTTAVDDPAFRRCLENPLLKPVVEHALEEHQGIFTGWTGQGPLELHRLMAEAAPGPAGEPWQTWLGQAGQRDGNGDVPGLWRVGSAVIDRAPEREEFPAAVPLLDESHLSFSSTPETRAQIEGTVEALLLRLISYFQPGAVQLHVWDVAQLTGALPGLYPLARAGLLTVHDPARLHELLDEFAEHIRRIHTSVLVDGRPSLRAVAEATGRRTEPWRVAVLFGNRTALEEQLQQKLQRIARNGLACGIQLILVDLPITVNSPLETIRVGKDGVVRGTMTGPHASVTLDPQLPREQVTKACGAISESLLERRSRVCTFDDLLPEARWSSASSSGLEAPIGYHDGEPVSMIIGDASPHVLVGGPSGSGKTNFLYAMLGALVSRYSPDELELYLLDFKEGVSFAQFTPGRKDPSWLPHARLVGVNVNADREFGLALLKFLADEMRRRADAAKHHEVTKLEELRAEDPAGRWPRIVAVIDEFQYLFAERDAVTSRAVGLLEDVARRGRSQGIHLVLSSQDVSGIEAFWGKPAIFEQFVLRVALPKARRVLAETNLAAMEVPRRHAVINHDSGVRHGNEIARVPDATSKGTFDALQLDLWQRRAESLAEPLLFDGEKVPRLSTVDDFTALRPGAGVPTALLGQVIDVSGSAAKVRMVRSPGRNVAAIGSVLRDATGVLGAAALSLSRQHAPGEADFTVAYLTEDASASARSLAEELTAAGHGVDVIDLDGIRAKLDGLAEGLNARLSGTGTEAPRPHYVLLYAIDAAYPLLENKNPATRQSGLDTMKFVLKHGPEFGTHVIGWWRSAQRLKSSLIGGALDDIGSWVALDVHGQELSSLAAGQIISWAPRPRRGLFFDRFEHAKPEVVIPFDIGIDPSGGEL